MVWKRVLGVLRSEDRDWHFAHARVAPEAETLAWRRFMDSLGLTS
jgi:hypothetical protein